MLGGVVEVAGPHLPDEVELEVLGREVVEQASAAAEQHRDDVQLQLVDLTGTQECLGRAGAGDRGHPVADRGPGLPGALGDVGEVADVPGGVSSGISWVRTKIGTPLWWSPPQRPASS